MDRRTRLYLFAAGTILVSYLTGQWILTLGFALGYYGQKTLSVVLIGGFGMVLLSFFSIASAGVLGILILILGGVLLFVPLFVIGAVEAALGAFIGRRAKG